MRLFGAFLLALLLLGGSPTQAASVHRMGSPVSVTFNQVADVRHKFNTSRFFFIPTLNGRLVVTANRQYGSETSTCYLYVKEGESVSYNWQVLGKKIDDMVLTLGGLFGEYPDVDHNNHLVFLFYKFYQDNSYLTASFVQDMLKLPKSNRMELVFVNLNVLKPEEDPFLVPALAHQLQHLIGFNERVIARHLPLLPSSLDEWMSKKAEDLVMQKNPVFLTNPYSNQKRLEAYKQKNK